jgi:hypothetical protein
MERRRQVSPGVGEGEGRRRRQWRRRTEVREEEGDRGKQREVRDGGWFERKSPDIQEWAMEEQDLHFADCDAATAGA